MIKERQNEHTHKKNASRNEALRMDHFAYSELERERENFGYVLCIQRCAVHHSIGIILHKYTRAAKYIALKYNRNTHQLKLN